MSSSPGAMRRPSAPRPPVCVSSTGLISLITPSATCRSIRSTLPSTLALSFIAIFLSYIFLSGRSRSNLRDPVAKREQQHDPQPRQQESDHIQPVAPVTESPRQPQQIDDEQRMAFLFQLRAGDRKRDV